MKTKWYYPIAAFVFLLVYFFIWTNGESLLEILIGSIFITLIVTIIAILKKRKNEKKYH